MKQWILLSGDDDGNHYMVYPTSEDRDDWNYETHLLVATGNLTCYIEDVMNQKHDKVCLCILEKATAGTMAVVDLDNDGYVEIIAAGYSAGEVYVFTYAPE